MPDFVLWNAERIEAAADRLDQELDDFGWESMAFAEAGRFIHLPIVAQRW